MTESNDDSRPTEARLRKLEERDKDKQAAIESAFESLEPFARKGAVPIEDLQALVREWEKQRTGDRDVDKAFERAAKRLEETIEEYEHE